MQRGRIKTHGKSNTATYKIWISMKNRCLNKKNKSYHNYGGRGIIVCKKWLKFENFLLDMGEKPKNKSIDRIDINGNYEPNNVKWSTAKEQADNRRDNRYYTFNGKTQNLEQWSIELGINKITLYARLNYLNWSVRKAFTQPKRSYLN